MVIFKHCHDKKQIDTYYELKIQHSTDFGVLQVQQLRKRTPSIRKTLREQNVICCSGMVRTMETALFLYPHRKKIYVLPYLEEIRSGPSSGEKIYRLSIREETESKLTELGHDISVFDWSIHNQITKGKYMMPDVTLFKSEVMPVLRKRFKRKKILCVTHGNWMTTFLKQCRSYNQVVRSDPVHVPKRCQKGAYPQKIGNCTMIQQRGRKYGRLYSTSRSR